MTHLDEATLHAYLDGELGSANEAAERHLGQCADCRTWLDDVRRVRARAGDILGASGPGEVAGPAFEELVARAQARRRQRVFRIGRLRAGAWAATLVLAVGVGWLARGALLPVGRSAGVADRAPDTAAPIAQALRALPDELPPTDVTEDRSDQAPARAMPSAVPQPSVEPRDQIAAPIPPAAAAAEPAARRLEANVEAPRRELALAPARPPDSAAGRRDSALARRIGEGEIQLDAIVVTGAAAKAQPAPQTGRAADEAGAAAGIVQAAPEPVWRMVDETQARLYLAGPVARVAGIPVLGYAIGSQDGQPAVRVTQLVGGEQRLELVQTRPPAEPAADLRDAVQRRRERPALEEDSVYTLTTWWGDYLLTLRGTMPADSLRAMLQKVRGEK